MTIESITRIVQSHHRRQLEANDFPGYQHAAVLMPIVETAEGLAFILTIRTHDVESHKGQISFPGGVTEAIDDDCIATALREAREEIGLLDSDVRVLGVLDDYPVPSGYLVTPVVGYLRAMPDLLPQPGEVSGIFTVPVSFFADSRNGRTDQRMINGKAFDVWYFQAGPHLVWGATATIIRGLINLMESSAPAHPRT